MPYPRLILASRSPRRADILRALGIAFDAVPAEVDETPMNGEKPESYAERLALEKARAVSDINPKELIVGADTVVHLGGRIYDVPGLLDEARFLLSEMSGKTHRVTTAVALVRKDPPREALASETTEVTFRALDADTIERYIASKEPYDKAGGYGIQALGGLMLVSRVSGSYTNVVGLPVDALMRLLADAESK